MTTPQTFGPRTRADDVLAGRSLTGQRIVVTGANIGIGYDTARALAAAGAELVLACRDTVRGNEALHRILAAHPGAQARCLPLDLGSLASIERFCAAMPEGPLHGIVCNAGLIAPDYAETAEGLERTVGVCHFGHFALVQRLLPRLLAAGKPRVVMVASESHRQPRQLDFEAFPLCRENYFAMKAYGQAKLCNVLMAAELQRRHGAAGLTACSLHPGTMVTTNIGSESLLVRAVMRLVSPFTKDCAQGAATSVWALVHEPASDIAGQYLRDCRVGRASREGEDPAPARRLWELSERWLAEHARG
ncbi:MAG: SDR family NAD(P)-dependent oxidoreductase [Gammaproteobacteria bacterium]